MVKERSPQKPLKILDLMRVGGSGFGGSPRRRVRLVKFFTNSGYTLGDLGVRRSSRSAPTEMRVPRIRDLRIHERSAVAA